MNSTRTRCEAESVYQIKRCRVAMPLSLGPHVTTLLAAPWAHKTKVLPPTSRVLLTTTNLIPRSSNPNLLMHRRCHHAVTRARARQDCVDDKYPPLHNALLSPAREISVAVLLLDEEARVNKLVVVPSYQAGTQPPTRHHPDSRAFSLCA